MPMRRYRIVVIGLLIVLAISAVGLAADKVIGLASSLLLPAAAPPTAMPLTNGACSPSNRSTKLGAHSRSQAASLFGRTPKGQRHSCGNGRPAAHLPAQGRCHHR